MSEDNAVVFDCTYQYLKAIVGGAIQINQPSFQATINTSIFYYCSATGGTSSSSRDADTSGGSIYLNVKTLSMNQIYTSYCTAAGYGHAIYLSCPDYQFARITCYSDFHSGQKTTLGTGSTIICSDKAFSFHSYLNFSYPSELSASGAIHVGKHTLSADLSYVNVVFDENDCDAALALTSNTNGLTKCSYVNILNCIDSPYGVITFWSGNFELSFLNFLNCVGTLAHIFGENTKITFTNSYFCEGVVAGNSVTITNTIAEAPEKMLVDLICPKENACSCKRITDFKSGSVLLFLYVLCWNS